MGQCKIEAQDINHVGQQELRKEWKRSGMLVGFFRRRQREPIFGNTLIRLHELTGHKVPEFVSRVMDIIETEPNIVSVGIYRSSSNVSAIQAVKTKINGYNYEVLEEHRNNVTVLTGAHKLFYRELKEPLVGEAQCKRLLNLIEKNPPDKYKQVEQIIKTLREPHRDTLVTLLEHLVKIVEREAENRMNISSMAICWGPLMFPVMDGKHMNEFAQGISLVELLLKTYKAAGSTHNLSRTTSLLSVRSECQLGDEVIKPMKRFVSEWDLLNNQKGNGKKFGYDLLEGLLMEVDRRKNLDEIYNPQKYKPNGKTVGKILTLKRDTKTYRRVIEKAKVADLGRCLLREADSFQPIIPPNDIRVLLEITKEKSDQVPIAIRTKIAELPDRNGKLLLLLLNHLNDVLQKTTDSVTMLYNIAKSWSPLFFSEFSERTLWCLEEMLHASKDYNQTEESYQNGETLSEEMFTSTDENQPTTEKLTEQHTGSDR